MQMKNLVVGDVVWLKSNKVPQMTIKSIEKEEAICQWFDGNFLREGIFSLNSLASEKSDE
jgi:uncharacterized protein YodC (DUF2158 family)